MRINKIVLLSLTFVLTISLTVFLLLNGKEEEPNLTSNNETTTGTQTTEIVDEIDPNLILWYPFNEEAGTTVVDVTDNQNDGLLVNDVDRILLQNGENAITLNGVDEYVKLPNSILKDLDEVTISIDVFVDASNKNPSWVYTFGSLENAQNENSRYLGLLNDSSNKLRVPITTNRWTSEQNTAKGAPIDLGAWTNYTITYSNNTITLYEDGVKVGKNKNITIDLSQIGKTNYNYIGKPAYINDAYLKGSIKDFKIYNRALNETEILEQQSLDDLNQLESDVNSFSLGDVSGVTDHLNLPQKAEFGSTIKWTSSNLTYLSHLGYVTRPSFATGNQTVKLSALFTNGDYSETKTFDVTILAEYSDEVKLQMAADQMSIPNQNDIRGNITLPESLTDGITVTWESSLEDIISSRTIPASENDGYAPIPLGVVNRQTSDTTVTLTATLSLNGHVVRKEMDVTVKALVNQTNDYTGYLFSYFAGEYRTNGEQIYFATSNDGFYWDDLNGNQPVLTSNIGEKGVRDPFIMRSPEGDKFYMIATDLSINKNPDWWKAQSRGSKSIVVWESTDLVNWSEPRLVEVARGDAGCTWAPEFIYDEKTGEYLVFWASRVASDNYAKQRIYVSKTRDFYTFTTPVVYIEKSKDVIDSTIVEYDGLYYRFTKDETSKNIIIETSETLLGEFTSLPNNIGSIFGVEGPSVFKINGENKWILLLDEYGGRGYVPYMTTDLSTGTFTEVTNMKMPTGARHGSVIPITQAEYDALQNKWNH